METGQIIIAVIVFSLIFAAFAVIVFLDGNYNLNNIKNKTIGDGQYGTARWSTEKEKDSKFKLVKFDVKHWREGINRPTEQGIIVGCRTVKNETIALIDTDDIHALMLGAAGTGKTAYFLYPNLEYACASGMSFLTTDTKGDLVRNYGNIAKECYGYNVAVIDLRNPTCSDGNNILHLVNKYMDLYKKTNLLAHKAKAEKYAKIVSKTIIANGSDGNYGQNAYFYDSAEGILTAAILIIAEFCEPEKRHIVSVFKIIQDLLAPSKEARGKNQFQVLMDKLPPDHKARWFAGSSLNSAEQSMASVISTAMSRLNAFLDSELEQILCFDTAIDAESFCNKKSAVFIILPEEDNTKFFMVSLIVEQMYREILAVADETGGKLQNRVMFYLDEFGTLPKIESCEMMFSASRSRRVSIVPIIQSFSQLYKNYGKEGGEIILDNCQVGLYAGFSPNSNSAKDVSEMLGNRTVLTGSISKGKGDGSQSLQMMQRQLMTPDELKSMKKGNFVITKTGMNPMQSTFKLFFQWGIEFTTEFFTPSKATRVVKYADKAEIEKLVTEYRAKYDEQHTSAEANMEVTKEEVADAGKRIKERTAKELADRHQKAFETAKTAPVKPSTEKVDKLSEVGDEADTDKKIRV